MSSHSRAAWVVPLATVLAACEGSVSPSPAGPDDGAVEVSVWAPASLKDRYWLEGPRLAAARLEKPAIRVRTLRHPGNTDTYEALFEEAARRGRAPDVVLVPAVTLVQWAEAGFLEPLDDCLQREPGPAAILPGLLPQLRWGGQTWGIPVDARVSPLFFSKPRLRDLGWSAQEIEALPERIARGAFTFDALLDTAEQAIRSGVVEPGFGYYPGTYHPGHVLELYLSFGCRLRDPSGGSWTLDEAVLERAYARELRMADARLTLTNLQRRWRATLLDRRIMRDTVAHRVLFWRAGLYDWTQWALYQVSGRGGRSYLFEAVGMAVGPSGIAGRPGILPALVEAYGLTAARASGRDRTAAACALLAGTLSPAINARHVAESGRLSALRSEALASAGVDDRLLRETAYMTDYLLLTPNDMPSGTYLETIREFLQPVLDHKVTPAAAAGAAARKFEAALELAGASGEHG